MLEIAITNAIVASLLACIVAVVLRFCNKPALSHALWILVLIKLLVWPIVDMPIPDAFLKIHQSAMDWTVPSSSNLSDHPLKLADNVLTPLETTSNQTSLQQQVQQSEEAKVTSPPAAVSLPAMAWSSVLVGLWIIGCILFAAMAVFEILRFRKATRSARPIDQRLRRLAVEVAENYQMSVPKIRMVNETMSPVVWCLFSRPTVYVPDRLFNELDDRQAATLLAHEFAHIKRRDYVVRWLELVTTVVYWWLPVVWLARRRLRAAEEQLCDALVVQHFPNKTSSYVSTLLQTVEFLIDSHSSEPMLASNMGNFRILKRRCEMIMGQSFKKLSNRNRALLWTLAVATLPIAISLPAADVAQAQTVAAPSGGGEIAPTSGDDTFESAPSGGGELAPTSDGDLFDESAPAQIATGVANRFANSAARHDGGMENSKALDPGSKFELGDLRMNLGQLLDLKDFERKSDSHRGGDPFGDSDLSIASNATAAGTQGPRYWTFSRPTKAFSEIYYYERLQKANYFRFQVREKFDQVAAITQLERQLTRNFGASRGTRRLESDNKVLTISYHVDRRNDKSPAVVIELREIPNWAQETDNEKQDRDKSRSAANDDLFG